MAWNDEKIREVLDKYFYSDCHTDFWAMLEEKAQDPELKIRARENKTSAYHWEEGCADMI